MRGELEGALFGGWRSGSGPVALSLDGPRRGSGAEVCLGYKSQGNEIVLQVSSLAGFILAMAPGGLRALKVLDTNEYSSQ